MFDLLANGTAAAIERVPAHPRAYVQQMDAAATREDRTYLVSTDPPYFANVGYADLSDIFYIWLRKSADDLMPQLFSTLLVPKDQEIVADPDRFGGTAGAEAHFLESTRRVFGRLKAVCASDVPATIYYAYKQEEEDEDDSGSSRGGRSSTGWETFLE